MQRPLANEVKQRALAEKPLLRRARAENAASIDFRQILGRQEAAIDEETVGRSGGRAAEQFGGW